MTSAYQRIVETSVALIKASPEGVRFLDLKQQALKKHPDLNINTLSGALNRFRNNLPHGIIRPIRGLYVSEDAWKRRDPSKVIPTRAPARMGKK